jgi:hypothetical protein
MLSCQNLACFGCRFLNGYFGSFGVLTINIIDFHFFDNMITFNVMSVVLVVVRPNVRYKGQVKHVYVCLFI